MTRPSNERDGACICDYDPATTDGPQEDCPFHGRPYSYWIERGDTLADERDELRCQLAATRIQLHAAREALAACREVAAKRAGQ